MKVMPNILLLMTDQHNPQFVGCEGVRPVRTPNLDALAARGTRFTNCHCANPLSVPSRMTFLTGRYSSDINVWSNDSVLDSRTPTVAHHLRKAGYESILCGRMHFTGPDQRHGFERRIFGDVDPRFEHIPPVVTGQTAEGVKIAGPGHTAYTRYDEEVAEVACEYLKQWDRDPGSRPFFLTVGMVLPHCPYICPRHLFRQYLERVDVPALPERYVEDLHPAMQAWRRQRGVDDLTEGQVRAARAAYFGLVTYMDEMVGQILDVLEQTRFADDTLVIYCSDHGDMAGELGMWGKSSLYQGSVGVPLIMSWPGRIAEGRRVSEVCSLVDLPTTLLDLSVEQPMPKTRGRSLRPFLTRSSRQADWPQTAIAECLIDPQTPARMVRRGPWKLNLYHGHEHPQLFNLEEDPEEVQDLGREAQHSAVRDDLLTLARQGWDPQRILEQVQHPPTLESLTQGLRPPAAGDTPDRWTCPEGANVFPDLG